MSFKTTAVIFLLATQSNIVSASPVSTGSHSGSGKLVKVPGGFLPIAKVHAIPPGGTIVHTADVTQLLDVDGSVLHSATRRANATFSKPILSHTAFAASKEPTEAIPGRNQKRSLLSASVSALWEAPSVYSFISRWTVPLLPQQGHQVLRYYTALVPPSADAIIQPVLQYGTTAAGGGQFWSISSWYLDYSSGTAYFTNATRLPSTQGTQYLSPFVINNDEFGGTPSLPHAWYFGFEYWQTQTGVNLYTTEDYRYVYVSLEVTNATNIVELPSEEPTILDNIVIGTTSEGGYASSIPWSIQNDEEDGVSILIASSSGAGGGGALDIRYTS
ncbi:hypothetical protein CVT26_013555 [Gymnopilus dilepis]|uniref:Uncharacterized protein n=1 Tax=Gymnopilus dilepis TaxID=231916 RepID=A0A409YX08_9AGAR|nr:hypothetical protein CVT26_013555 [Gymnopilus dilepis]